MDRKEPPWAEMVSKSTMAEEGPKWAYNIKKRAQKGLK